MVNDMEEALKRIQEYSLEEIMGERYASYAKEIIQDRAIPDVRDGLKPVQRRILYAMQRANNTHERGYIKSASTVGDVLGKYHPHGDSSVYDAMVRMSQWWKQNHTLIDMHGNNGSMDGDGAAAYRYTEARLSKISSELLKDIDKNTVTWAPNFDDRYLEPTVLPAKFPNLLVNGAMGISAGYATNIPPHNLGEIIDATVKRIENPNCRLDTILDIVKGPDFPTGGIVEGAAGIREAFATGRGKVIVRSKYEIHKEKGKEQIIISEIPFEVNKAGMVNKIDAIRIDKKIDGMQEVRDESDREGLRIVIDLKPNANKDLILNYLFKNTELQIAYNYNMVAIMNRRPMTLGILPILDAYIAHQKEVILKRTKFDFDFFSKQKHITEGLVKCISILDDVIRVIRASKNKKDAKDNLVKEFAFTEEQSEAIVTLQLYKLTNTDVIALQEELAKLEKILEGLKLILEDEEALKDVMKRELKNIKKEYAIPRKTEVKDEITEIKIDATDMIPKENVIVLVTKEGYLKRVSTKSYASGNGEEPTLKPGDYITGLYEVNTLDTILMFTNMGRYLYIPVHTIFEAKWKELGKHVSNLIPLNPNEEIISSMVLEDKNDEIIFFTKQGVVKKSKLEDYIVSRYSKPMTAIKLKEDDALIAVVKKEKNVCMISENGYYVRFLESEIPLMGAKSGGVRGMNLKEDHAVMGISYPDEAEYITLFTNQKTAKRLKVSDLLLTGRAKKGSTLLKKVKSTDYKVLTVLLNDARDELGVKSDSEIKVIKASEIPIMDFASTGSNISKHKVDIAFVIAVLQSYTKKKKETKEETQVEGLPKEEIEELTLDDFLDDFKL